MKGDVTLFQVERLELGFKQKPWSFADERRADIGRYFAALQREKPVWNGRVLLLHRQAISGGVFYGDYLETDYASFAAWRQWGSPPAGVHDCFGAAAVQTADGAFLLGVMGSHTLNAGNIYFFCGTPDPDDIVGSKVDLASSVRRELKEETGIDMEQLDVEPRWTTVVDGPLIVQVRLLRAADSAEAVRKRILEFLARERQPELSDIRIVRSARDFDPAMPRFVTAFLAQQFA
ncbi:MAG TPA: NUDIX hydrolase [Pseudolabrys sp.]|nr:NUDIX hydrolase [Pseudolabrys sp.]